MDTACEVLKSSPRHCKRLLFANWKITMEKIGKSTTNQFLWPCSIVILKKPEGSLSTWYEKLSKSWPLASAISADVNQDHPVLVSASYGKPCNCTFSILFRIFLLFSGIDTDELAIPHWMVKVRSSSSISLFSLNWLFRGMSHHMPKVTSVKSLDLPKGMTSTTPETVFFFLFLQQLFS